MMIDVNVSARVLLDLTAVLSLSPCLREQGTLKMKDSIWNQIIAPLSTHVMDWWSEKYC